MSGSATTLTLSATFSTESCAPWSSVVEGDRDGDGGGELGDGGGELGDGGGELGDGVGELGDEVALLG